MPAQAKTTSASAKEQFERDGFIVSEPLVDRDLIERSHLHFQQLMSGVYETGIDPGYPDCPAEIVTGEPESLYRLYQPHLADRTIRKLVTQPVLGEYAASLWDASWIQLWGVTFLYKPPFVKEKGNIGWHQDHHYFTTIWQPGSEAFFMSLAISDVTADMGPVLMIRGSHAWGYLREGDFYNQDMQQVRSGISVPRDAPWEEVPLVMPGGTVSCHHKDTFHGSLANGSGKPRLSVLLELRTERSTPIAKSDSYYVKHLDDHQTSPVIYGG